MLYNIHRVVIGENTTLIGPEELLRENGVEVDVLGVAQCRELLVIMSPEHAHTINRDGWGKEDVKNYIHENSLLLASLGDRGGRKLDDEWIIDGEVRITRSPQDVILLVAGGPGRHTMISHSFGTGSQSVTVPLTLKSRQKEHNDEFKVK